MFHSGRRNWRTCSSRISWPIRRGSQGEPLVSIHQRRASAPCRFEGLPRIELVAERLRHLAAVFGDQVPQADDVAIRRLIEMQHAFGHQGVEPPAGLVDRLGDEVGWEARLERLDAAPELGVVAPLRERHRAGVVPGVDHLGDACRDARTRRAGERDLVEERAMWVDVVHVASRRARRARSASRSPSRGHRRIARSAAAYPSTARATAPSPRCSPASCRSGRAGCARGTSGHRRSPRAAGP